MKNLGFLGYPEYAVCPKGQVMNLRTGYILKPTINDKGYPRVTLCVNYNRKDYMVHRLIMMTYRWFDGCETTEINHINGDKTNYQLENLEWSNRVDNNIHAYRTGLNPNRILEEDRITEICELLQDGWRNVDIVKTLDVSRHTVEGIRQRKLYTYISKDYKWTSQRHNRKSPETIMWICELLQEGKKPREIEEITGVCRHYVGHIKTRTINKKISQNYTW